ncbi:MAG: hypothetical protein WAW96_01945 [Alphaproteobacteria bacterium]
MKPIIRPLALAAALFSLTACVTAPKYQGPPTNSAPIAYKIAALPSPAIGPSAKPRIGGPPLSTPDQFRRYLDKNESVLYFQNYGGGGVALGLLAGPLGVLANAKMIEGVTAADAAALRGKLDVDVRGRFSAALGAHPAFVDGENGALFSPYLLVEKIDDEHMKFASMLSVDLSPSGKTWSRRYIYELPDTYTKTQLSSGLTAEQVQMIASHFEIGMNWNLATLEKETRGELKPGKQQQAHSEFVTPRITVAQIAYRFDSEPGRAAFVSGDAIYSLDEASVRFTN